MANLSIWPIKMGVNPGMEKSNLTQGINVGVKLDTPIIVYVIKGAPKNIMVDSGGPGPEWIEKYHEKKTVNYQDIETGLKKIDLNPEDIDILICTHLHWDHCFNNHKFKNARILVQRDEIRYAIAPLPMHALFYESQTIGMRPPWLNALENIEIVDGDKELISGVELIKIPGHTPGFQGVKVKTSAGYYFIAGDFCPLFENWEGVPPLKHVVSPIHVNLEDYYKSFEKVEKLADVVLPGHDLKVFEKESYP